MIIVLSTRLIFVLATKRPKTNTKTKKTKTKAKNKNKDEHSGTDGPIASGNEARRY
jgi:hypothetical protein